MSKLSVVKNQTRILVVEDESIVALDLERGLKRLGYNVAGVASNGHEAIAKTEESRPDLILMDIQLKGDMDGIAAAKQILERFEIPVVFLSAYSDDNTLERTKKCEAFGYLLKPFEEAELRTTIETVLHKHQMICRKMNESSDELKLSKNCFEKLVNSITDYGVFTIDPDGLVADWNAGAERVLGYRSDEIIGKQFFVFHTDKDLKAQVPQKELLAAAKDGHFSTEGLRVRKDGTQFWASVTIAPLLDRFGKIRGYSEIIRDLTERQRAETALQTTNESLERRVQERTLDLKKAIELRDEFLSIASHELKNPLTSLSMNLQLLSQMAVEQACATNTSNSAPQAGYEISPARVVKMAERCEAQTENLNVLIDELLDLARIRMGKFELRKEITDLSAIVRAEVKNRKLELEHSGLKISANANTPVIGNWDSVRVRQIFTNLLSNAIKYGNGTPIEVSTSLNLKRNIAILSVRDHGKGISPEMQPKIFRRFERAGADKNVPGLGLGLYIVQQIVEAHGGAINVSSEPEKGATFTVELPLNVFEQAKAQ